MEMHEFNPVLYSDAENEFLLAHLGEPTVVALRDAHPPLVAAAIRPVLDRVNEFIELEKHDGSAWCGVEALKNAIRVWFRENSRWRDAHKRNRRIPRWPSMYSFDAKGKPHRGGPGSDSGCIKTYFGPNGERIPFAVQFVREDEPDFELPFATELPGEPRLFDDPETNRLECRVKVGDGICGHTESYKAGSRTSYIAARARMSKHLRKATENVEDHREVYTNVFTE